MPEAEEQVDRGLDIGTVEGAIFRGMLVGAHAYMEGRFDGRHAAFDLDIHAVTRASNDLQAVVLREAEDGVIVLLRGAEAGGELRGRKKLTVRRAGWIVEIIEETLEACAVTELENEVKLQCLICREPAVGCSLTRANHVTHMVCHNGLRLTDRTGKRENHGE